MKKILLIVVGVLAVLIVLKDPLLKTALTFGTAQVTGVPVKVKSFSLSFLRQKVSIKGFRLYNPPGFPKDVFVDIPEITVAFNVPAFLGGKLHLPSVVVNLKEMVVYKDKDGNLNVDALKFAQDKEAPAQEAKKKQPAKPVKMQIDQLSLTVGKVVMKDYSRGGDEPVVQVYDVGIKDKVFRDITSPEQLMTLIMVEAMGPTAIKGAAIYGVASMLGVAFLPAGVAGVLLGQDSSTADFRSGFDQAYAVSLDVAKQMGEVASEQKGSGVIKAKIDGCTVTIEVKTSPGKGTKITVAARKFMLPKPEIAGGVLYNISEKLK